MIIQVSISPKVMRWTEAAPGSDPDTSSVATEDIDGGDSDAAVVDGFAGDEDPDSFNMDVGHFDF